jgi:hypothetical protein
MISVINLSSMTLHSAHVEPPHVGRTGFHREHLPVAPCDSNLAGGQHLDHDAVSGVAPQVSDVGGLDGDFLSDLVEAVHGLTIPFLE